MCSLKGTPKAPRTGAAIISGPVKNLLILTWRSWMGTHKGGIWGNSDEFAEDSVQVGQYDCR